MFLVEEVDEFMATKRSPALLIADTGVVAARHEVAESGVALL